MKNHVLKVGAGDNFTIVAQKAKSKAIRLDERDATETHSVEFDFNGIKCVVDRGTKLNLLWRDYGNAHRMDWKKVGAVCLLEYPKEIQDELNRRNKLREQKEKNRQIGYQEKCDREKEALSEKTKGINIDLSDSILWEKGKSKNTDPYGGCVYVYAENWAKLMQAEMAQGKTLIQCAEKTSHELGYLGITGFMYGAAVSVLSSCWKHGEELRKWHNKEYDHEGKGVVNPAILIVN